ncbi:MAG: phosphoribosylformylglycinamidine cyclo-ligase [Candidatus Sumerlaeaceae bacterium]
MARKKAVTYAEAGVDIVVADEFVNYIRSKKPAIGGFSGLYRLPNVRSMKRPMLVGSTDGVGTKLLIAKALRRFDTIGIDLVAMVANDLITCGAKPLFFLDYYATGKLTLDEAKAIFDGILAGCEQAQMEMLGGETAELPGLYAHGDFDLAGFGVGLVDGVHVLDGSKIRPGDLVFGFESSGLHANGYSLVRKVLLEQAAMKLTTCVRELSATLGEVLLTPTRIYVALVEALRKAKVAVKAYAHITGGGIPGNLCRVLPKNMDAVVYKNRWETPPIFKLIQRCGPVDYEEMLATFNMGIGFMAVAPEAEKERLVRVAQRLGQHVHLVGEIVKGSGKVRVEIE